MFSADIKVWNIYPPRLNLYFLTVVSCVLEVVIILVETKKN